MPRVIVPRAPGHFCAFGMLFSDLRYDLVRTWFARLADVSFDAIEAVYARARSPRAARRSRRAASGRSASRVARAADMRYVGQEHPVTVAAAGRRLSAARRARRIKRQFDEVHQQRYGTMRPEEPAEIVSLRATVTGVHEEAAARAHRARRPRAARASAQARHARVYFAELGKAVATPIYRARRAARRQRIAGPALDRGACLDHGAAAGRPHARSIEFGNLVIEVGEEHEAA